MKKKQKIKKEQELLVLLTKGLGNELIDDDGESIINQNNDVL